MCKYEDRSLIEVLHVTKPPTRAGAAAREPRRSDSRSNRARILAVARHELGVDPDATLEEIARAAGVVRRTVYGHFPGRTALLEALVEEAEEALKEVLAALSEHPDPPERALARMVLAIWPIGDRYRMLIGLARRDLGAETVTRVLAPARDHSTAVLERGRAAGVFHEYVPAAVLSAGLEALCLSLLESVNTGAWQDDTGEATAAAILVAAGVPPTDAATTVRSAARPAPRR